MIPPFVGQEGGGLDLMWIILPLLCCMMTMTQRGERPPSDTGRETESWYTSLDIESAYKEVDEETSQWRERAQAQKQDGGIIGGVKKLLGRGEPQPRFEIDEEEPPKLLTMRDRTGHIYFELTEVEDGGTVVKATYNAVLKGRVAKFKTKLPIKIPATPIGLNCPSCGKPVLPEFDLCPYCGERLIKE